MDCDADLLRDLLLILENEQRSPRETTFVSLEDLAETLDRSRSELETHLKFLSSHDFIEGPGLDEDGFWLFRKLTGKGRWLSNNIRDPVDWRNIKIAYGADIA
jgi:DNA-binding MarR family transcriptional regulator